MNHPLLWIALASVPALASAQEPSEREPTDAVAALLACPVREHPTDGRRVIVIDSAKVPVPGAEVFVADWSAIGAPLQEYGLKTFHSDAGIWLAARSGARYRADANGVARVTCPPGASIGALDPATGAIGLLLLGERIVLRGARVHVPVEVIDAVGRPAAGVPVSIGHVYPQDFVSLAGGVTDSSGRTTLRYELPTDAQARVAEVHAACVDRPPARVAVTPEWLRKPGRLLQVQLPPAGSLRLRLRNAAGATVDDSRVTVRGAVHGIATVPVARDLDGYVFAPVAVGARVLVEMRHGGAVGAPQQIEVMGPSAAGETVEYPVVVELLPPKPVDPRIAAALAARGGAGGEVRLPLANGDRWGKGQAGVGRIAIEMPAALRDVEGLVCELERRGGEGERSTITQHEVPKRTDRASAVPPKPALLRGTDSGMDRRVLRDVQPGEYTLCIRLGTSNALRIENVVVQAGRDTEAVDRPTGAANVAALPVAAVQLLDEHGAELVGSVVLVSEPGRSHPRAISTSRGRVQVPCVDRVRMFAQSSEHRTVEVTREAVADALHTVRLEPRAKVRLRLPAGLSLPDGVVVVVPNEHAPLRSDQHAWRNDTENVVRPDASGQIMLQLWVETGLGLRALGCEQEAKLPAGAREVVVEFPIDQDTVDAAEQHSMQTRARSSGR